MSRHKDAEEWNEAIFFAQASLNGAFCGARAQHWECRVGVTTFVYFQRVACGFV
jgi:hypothetical protein